MAVEKIQIQTKMAAGWGWEHACAHAQYRRVAGRVGSHTAAESGLISAVFSLRPHPCRHIFLHLKLKIPVKNNVSQKVPELPNILPYNAGLPCLSSQLWQESVPSPHFF